MAVVVEENVLAGDLERVIAENKGELLKSWKIFDVYQGDQIAKGYKSIAFALTFQADRTLTDEEVSAAYDKVLKSLEAQYQAQLRN